MTASVYRDQHGRRRRRRDRGEPLQRLPATRPTSQPRGPIEVQGIRIGNDVGGPQGRRSASSSSARSTPASGPRRWSASRPPSGCVRNYADRPRDEGARGRPGHLHHPVDQPGRRRRTRCTTSRGQRKNMVELLRANPTGNNDPAARNTWGVDLNRNFSVGTLFDGYVGASTSCTGRTFAGPFGALRARDPQRDRASQTTYPNIKFAMNVHSSGGYFMWPPGAYKQADRETLPYPPYGTLNYFDQTAELGARTGSTATAGRRSCRRRPARSPTSCTPPPATQRRRGLLQPTASSATPSRPAPTSAWPTARASRWASSRRSAPCRSAATPNLANEGHDEAMEFANGNYALLKSALDYASDTTPPSLDGDRRDAVQRPVGVRFTSQRGVHRSATRRTARRRPTASPSGSRTAPRELPDPVELDRQHDAEVVRDRLQGQPLRGAVEGLRGRPGRARR